MLSEARKAENLTAGEESQAPPARPPGQNPILAGAHRLGLVVPFCPGHTVQGLSHRMSMSSPRSFAKAHRVNPKFKGKLTV